MKVETLQKLKVIENDHTLEILLIDFDANINNDTIMILASIGNLTIGTETSLKASKLIAKYRAQKNISINIFSNLNRKKYDILISPNYSSLESNAINIFKFKYIGFFNNTNFNLENYCEFEENFFKLSLLNKEIKNTDEKIKNEEHDKEENLLSTCKFEYQNISQIEVKYDKYTLNYLHEMEPGKVSVIMVVNQPNTKFPQTIKHVRAQNVPNMEIIVIDNASGFRSNVKANIRYGNKMPADFCIYQAKELCSGEYMILLDQDSDEPNILYEIGKGHYETR